MSSLKLRPLLNGAVIRPLFTKTHAAQNIIKRRSSHHIDEYPLPFDNLPFRVKNRVTCTVVFAFLYGAGLWAPFIIVWYMMAKRAL